MNTEEARKKYSEVRSLLKEMQDICSSIDTDSVKKELRPVTLDFQLQSKQNQAKSKKLHKTWDQVQAIMPAGYEVSGNLLRHLSFNNLGDWDDIANRDIPHELEKLEEYDKRLVLVEYVGRLHPEVARVAQTVLDDDIDGALKVVFTTLEAKARMYAKAKRTDKAVPVIAKAFKDEILVAPDPNDNDAIRNFLMGVIGYYRNNIAHHDLPSSRKTLEASLSLLGLAHESLKLLDRCRSVEID